MSRPSNISEVERWAEEGIYPFAMYKTLTFSIPIEVQRREMRMRWGKETISQLSRNFQGETDPVWKKIYIVIKKGILNPDSFMWTTLDSGGTELVIDFWLASIEVLGSEKAAENWWKSAK